MDVEESKRSASPTRWCSSTTAAPTRPRPSLKRWGLPCAWSGIRTTSGSRRPC